MIPKCIHYCWYGNGEMDEQSKQCIRTWREKCADYEIICWNEKNTDFSTNIYLQEAYDSKKYAFVTDYMRLYVLYNFGGFYMDTDVELLKSLDDFLECSAFTGVQEENVCVTGIIGSEAGNAWIKELLKYYDNRHFVKSDGSFDLEPNTVFITQYTKKLYNWKYSEKCFDVPNILRIYPFEVFCCKDYETGYIYTTNKSVAIHHFKGSWLLNKREKEENNRNKFKLLLIKVLGYKLYRRLLWGWRLRKYGKE